MEFIELKIKWKKYLTQYTTQKHGEHRVLLTM